MSSHNIVRRATVIESLIPRPPRDIVAMRNAFAGTVSNQWHTHVPPVLGPLNPDFTEPQLTKARFIGEMYARACYSMLLISTHGPTMLRVPMRAAVLLPQQRRSTIRLGEMLLAGLGWLLPRTVHRQLLFTSALMGMLDVVLDETAHLGEAAVLRVSSLITMRAPTSLLPSERPIVALAKAVRRDESAWQSGYWVKVLQPAVRDYCLAELLAITHAPDPSGMGHRWAGIDAAIKGMWYVSGPCMNLQGSLSRFEPDKWNLEQQWMADTSLLMQMIDDWVDQDEDSGVRMTPVAAGYWSPKSVSDLYAKTVRDLTGILARRGVRSPVLQEIFVDLYGDYLHTAIDAMCNGVAA